jgi:hypothetical protein
MSRLLATRVALSFTICPLSLGMHSTSFTADVRTEIVVDEAQEDSVKRVQPFPNDDVVVHITCSCATRRLPPLTINIEMTKRRVHGVLIY